jgi:hypothetical protein
MKKLLICLLALGSVSAFAQNTPNLKITNINSPEKQMIFTCTDDACDLVKFKFFVDNKVINYRLIEKSRIENAINRKNRIYHENGKPEFFQTTKGNLKETKRRADKGEYSNVLLMSVLTLISMPFDVLPLPYLTVEKIIYDNKAYSRKTARIMKDLKLNLEMDIEEVQLKEKACQDIYDAVMQVSVIDMYDFLKYDRPVMHKYVNNSKQTRCSINNHFTYFQLNVNDKWTTYTLSESKKLEDELIKLEKNGTCAAPEID